MLCLINIYNDILSDFQKSVYSNSNALSRRFELKGKTIILVSAYKSSGLAEISLSIYNNNPDSVGKLPKWKGMNEHVGIIRDNQSDRLFVSFKQSEDYDRKIYFTIMQDIVDSIEFVIEKDMLFTLRETLIKWSVFFEFEKNYVLSDSVQQGLYGELYVLEKIISLKGSNIIDCWTGCNAETHDFYLGEDALEVKSSSAKGPEKIKISNEYQLDDTGVVGRLFLMYLKMRKSEIYGETLPVIVERILSKLTSVEKMKFQNKLFKVGYLYQLPELYTVHFTVNDENCYKVVEGFPRITKHNISKGIGAVNYIVSLDACESFLITVETFYKGVTI